VTRGPRILRGALATASRWPPFARRLLSSQGRVTMPSRRRVPGTSGPSCEASRSPRFVLLVGQTHAPPSKPSLVSCTSVWRPWPSLPVFSKLPVLPVPSRLAGPSSLGDPRWWDLMECSPHP
uniref:Uncharacterized protein n=1 Tax=Canis lupus dingo TaxID=286419 RepID=A0A8C0KVG7_CANLU